MYLRPQVKLEPLVCGWYAWSYLIPPAQLAMNVAFRHLPLLQSFLANPTVHVAATEDPKLFGGPFVGLRRDDLPQVKLLLEQITTRCNRLIALARDLQQLEESLQSAASGGSLQAWHTRLPTTLGGLVEMYYDLNNHPQWRLLESLLYDDDLAANTQEIRLSVIPECERPFFMTTPRLSCTDALTLPVRFSDRGLDALAAARTNSTPLPELARQLDVPQDKLPIFQSLFTATPPERGTYAYSADGVRVRYFGHACVLIQTSRTSILLDPVLAFEPAADGRLTFTELPDFIDSVVLTHSHQDHCLPEALIQLRHRVGKVIVPRNNGGGIADPSMKLLLQALGFENIVVAEPFDSIVIPDGAIVSLPFFGEHADLDICSKQAVFVNLKERGLLFLVDSDGRDSVLYQRIMRKLGRRVQALFIGMECHGAPLTWLYGPLLTKAVSRRDDTSRRLSGSDCACAWAAVQATRPEKTFIYAMGQEPWLRYLMGLEYSADSPQLQQVGQFLGQCRQEGIVAERLNISRELLL